MLIVFNSSVNVFLQWIHEVTYAQMASGDVLQGGDQFIIEEIPLNTADSCIDVRACA